MLAAEGLTLESFKRLGSIAEGTRRPFSVPVSEARWSAEGSTVELSFTLPTGSYATVLLDEVMKPESQEARGALPPARSES